MRIGVDVDGVLANFIAAYEDLHILVGGDLFGARRYPAALPQSWNWVNYPPFNYPGGVTATVWELIKDNPRFWQDLATTPEFEAFKQWYWAAVGEHDIYFITDRSGIQPRKQTERWFQKNGIPAPVVLVSKHKGLCCHALNLDWYVDDRGENILDVERDSPNTRAVLIDQPYNRHVTVKERRARLMDALEVGVGVAA